MVKQSNTPIPDHLTITPSVLYFGTPVVLIVTQNANGTSNITPMSSAWALGSRVVLGLSPASQGAENLRREGECTLNFPSSALWDRVEKIAPTTGRNPVPSYKSDMGFQHLEDKFTLGGFSPVASEWIRTPRIADCPLQFEAKLAAVYHDDAQPVPGHLILDVEVVRVHAHREIVVPETHLIDTQRWHPLFYVFRHYFGNATDLGRNFRAEA